MTAIHVRNVPEPVLAALRERAERHGRSMQQEIREILAAAAMSRPPTEALAPISLHTVRTNVTAAWRRAEIYDDSGR